MGFFNGFSSQLARALVIGGAFFLVSCASTPPAATGIDQATRKSPLGEQYRSDYVKAISDLDTQNFDQASTALNRITTNNPGFVEGWANLSVAQLRAGNISQAKQTANKALKLEPQSATLYNLLGLISVESGAYKNAEQYYARALQLNPELANAHFNLALLNDIYFQNIAKAIQHYEHYLALINTADPDTESWVAELKRNLN